MEEGILVAPNVNKGGWKLLIRLHSSEGGLSATD